MFVAAATIEDDVNVEIWGVTDAGEVLLATKTYIADLPPGEMSASIETYIASVPSPLYDLKLKVDGGNTDELGVVAECVTSDNEVEWGALVCL